MTNHFNPITTPAQMPRHLKTYDTALRKAWLQKFLDSCWAITCYTPESVIRKFFLSHQDSFFPWSTTVKLCYLLENINVPQTIRYISRLGFHRGHTDYSSTGHFSIGFNTSEMRQQNICWFNHFCPIEDTEGASYVRTIVRALLYNCGPTTSFSLRNLYEGVLSQYGQL